MATSEKAAALHRDTRKAGTLQFKEMAEGHISDACKTVKAADEKNADQVFHKSYNTRHQEDLMKLADQLKTNEGQHCFAQSLEFHSEHLEFAGTKLWTQRGPTHSGRDLTNSRTPNYKHTLQHP